MTDVRRGLSEEFMDDLKREDGKLHSLLLRVQRDNTLLLCIRKDGINIYYRGGSLLKLTRGESSYIAEFDIKYVKNESDFPKLPSTLENEDHTKAWVEKFPVLKQFMDEHLTTTKQAVEREFQQLVVRENNYSPISNDTEYFIVDIEVEDGDIGARFDLIAAKWPAHKRKEGSVQLALVEMKYGDTALKGGAGIAKHLSDAKKLLDDPEKCERLRATAEKQLNQLNQLGLVRHSKMEDRIFSVSMDDKDNKPELILLLANHNPRATVLTTVLDKELKPFINEDNNPFNLRFFVASSAGYGMHNACMLDLTAFRRFIADKQPG